MASIATVGLARAFCDTCAVWERGCGRDDGGAAGPLSLAVEMGKWKGVCDGGCDGLRYRKKVDTYVEGDLLALRAAYGTQKRWTGRTFGRDGVFFSIGLFFDCIYNCIAWR